MEKASSRAPILLVKQFTVTTGWWPIVTFAAIVAALSLGWVGYTASDDVNYYTGAMQWLTDPPVAGDAHWQTRFPLVLTLAGAIAAFGQGFAAMNVTALIWYGIMLLCVRALARRIAGERASWIAVLLVSTMPVVVANATTVSCDTVEASFMLLGILLIGDAAINGRAGIWSALAGLGFAGAIFSRETSILALCGFLPIFLLGRPVGRRDLIVMGLACAALLGAEAVYQWILTGDPFHRWTLAFNHDSHINRAANHEGNFLIFAPIDPLLVLLINDDFTLIFWFAAAAIIARFYQKLDADARLRLVILWTLALSAFLLVGALYTKLVLNPRYFMLPAIAAALTVAIWLDRLEPSARWSLAALIVGANLLLISVSNQHPRWQAEALVLAVREHDGQMIQTDAKTRQYAEYMLKWQGLRHVEPAAPRSGDLVLMAEADIPADAKVIARYPSPPTKLGSLLSGLSLAGQFPSKIERRLMHPSPSMVLIQYHGRRSEF